MSLPKLFRKEAVEHHRQRLLGEVVLMEPATHWLVTTMIAVVICLVVSVIWFGTFARKESVQGWIRTDRGIAKVQTPEDGIVEEVSIREGQHVKAGDVIMTLRFDVDSGAERGFSERLASEMQRERLFLQRQAEALKSQHAVRLQRLADEATGVEKELTEYRSRLSLLEQRVLLAQRQLQERRSLIGQGFVSRLDGERLEDGVLAAQQAAQEQRQEIAIRETRLRALKNESLGSPHERNAAVGVLDERLAALDQRIAEAQRRRRVTLTAPVSGTVSDVRVEAGEAAKARTPLVDILPEGAVLEAELYAPSRAIGLLTKGSQVQLRYDAFPYQKYGVSLGRVERISRTSMDPKELPRGVSADEPVFRVVVSLPRPSVEFQGEQRPLQAGMTLKADLILERRRIAEFVFAPLFGAVRRG